MIESKKKLIDLRRLCATQSAGKGLDTWDLARFRIPRHAEYKGVEVLTKVKYLTFDFPTTQSKSQRAGCSRTLQYL